LETRLVPVTITWGNPNGGDWATPENWIGGVLPGPNDTAVISYAGITVTYSSDNPTVAGLALSGDHSFLDIQNGTLRVASLTTEAVAVSNNFTVTVDGGSLIDQTMAAFTVTGAALTVNSGTVSAPNDNLSIQSGGTLTLNGGSVPNGVLTIGTGVGSGSTFYVRTYTQGTTAQLTVNAGRLRIQTAFTNYAGGILTGGVYRLTGPDSLSHGTLQFPNADIVTNAATIDLNGPFAEIVDLSSPTPQDGLRDLAANNGSFTIENGRNFIMMTGDFNNAGTLNVGPGCTFQYPSDVTNFMNGMLVGGNFIVGGTLQFDNAAITTNMTGLALDSPNSHIRNSTGDALAQFATNAAGATFTLQNGASLTILSALTNAGTLAIGSGGQLTTTATFTNGGAVHVLAGGTFTLTGGGNIGSAFQVDTGGMLAFTSGTYALNAGTAFAGAGTIDIDGATVSVDVPTTTNNVIEFNAGTITGSATLVCNGTFDWNGGTMGGSGMSMFSLGSLLHILGTTPHMLDQRQLCNAGTAIWTGAGGIWLGDGGDIDNEDGGMFDIQGDGHVVYTGGAATFLNAGTVRKSAGTLTAVDSGITFTNSGTVDVESGTLDMDGTFTNFDAASGTLTGGRYVVAGSLEFDGANIVTDAAALELHGAGQIDDDSGNDALTVLTGVTSAGSLSLLGGHLLSTSGGLTNGGTVTIDGTSGLTVGGSYLQTAGATLLNGTLTATLVDVQSGSLSGAGTLIASITIEIGGTLAGSATINGDLIIQAGGILSGSERSMAT
jgi:hypothetical protein